MDVQCLALPRMAGFGLLGSVGDVPAVDQPYRTSLLCLSPARRDSVCIRTWVAVLSITTTGGKN